MSYKHCIFYYVTALNQEDPIDAQLIELINTHNRAATPAIGIP